MATYPAGGDVTIAIPFQDASGAKFVPLSAAYSVIDELENVVVVPTALEVDAAAGQVSIMVPAAVNTLPGPTTSDVNGQVVGTPITPTSGLREIDVVFTTAAGPVELSVRYFLGATRRLHVMQNSFQPFNQAVLIAEGMPGLDGWGDALTTDAQRINALAEAYTRLTRLGYFVRWPVDPDAQNYIVWGTTQNSVIVPRLWTVMSVDRWMTFYPEVFRAAMRKAQIAEADQILAGDPIRKKRDQGIISEKVGESSFMFRSRKPADLGVSPEALAYLTGYVDFAMKITRG